MLAVLSPAKKLDPTPPRPSLPATTPALRDRAAELVAVARRLSAADLSALMSISDTLGALNHQRFQSFADVETADNAKQAVLAFAGDVYVGLDAASLSDADLVYAQDHLAILSGLYGVLRPLDRIQPYRLEMGTDLATRRGPNLYKFWGDLPAKRLNALTEGHADRTLVNLASHEYFRAVRVRALAGPVVHVDFREWRAGKPASISFFAKRARGLMARFIVDERVDRPDGLRDFAREGYGFDAALSEAARVPGTLVFSRSSAA